ncbi:bifunctional 4-hydroxy-2-oxoglutarate aldolase/2-dehydro-3-deoxy-phosphogluconate aldolase [Pseudonocardia halophobica]|uniref:2-dehydro-3-deoxy-phosphogluconate aldolase n=1 Tax=Pseudonocardia halophobica TaxID=29401 RepID=A0A9W6L8I0_9PSEU|nr:bifunctional 4-hydroxy-2-oxoglutarate aldolase/2-dehydro-3-deoxy-phosphogluconate aldolase [Pseudonocardia halophobica]GLL14947.1 ketohydroxyglutarate aldolase [Pseudonocardia halophobica]
MSLLARCPVLPVVVLDDPAQALPLGEALLAGGVDVVEITLRTAAGLAGIRALSALPELHVGAGSVVVPRHVDEVVAAGARFVVSPGLSVSVLDRAVELEVPALPGVSGASDLMVATERGLTEVKFFPANLLGGVAGIRALAAPFPGMTFLPSGGVKPENMADYLALPCVPAISGSWMVDPELLAAGRWDEVSARAADALRRARGAVPVG